MNLDDWIEQYRPLRDEDGEPRLFALEGDDRDFVFGHPARRIWTSTEGDEYAVILSGVVENDAIGYHVTEVACPDDLELQIDIYDEDEHPIEYDD